MTFEERFWSKVTISDGCWAYGGSTNNKGYGAICGKVHGIFLAHRYAYFFWNGELPNGALVCHKCDNRICVRPSHLFLGTPKENSQDMARKGRSAMAVGARSSRSKLTSDDAWNIRRLYDAGMPTRQLGARFGVDARTATKIGRREAWFQ